MFGSMDITFCNGEFPQVKDGKLTMVTCPVRENCHRFWTEEHRKKAIETGDTYHSFFVMSDSFAITENGCENFWREK